MGPVLMNQSTKLTHKHRPNTNYSVTATSDRHKGQRSPINPNLKRRISPWKETSQRSEYSRDSKLRTNKNPPTPTSDQIDSLIPTIAETGRIKYKFQKKKKKKKKKKFRNKEKITKMMRW